MSERRIRRTTKSFKTHLISLIKQKGYSSVTVTDIVEQADYNRSTFYSYYLDKEDLATQLLDEMMEMLSISFLKPFDAKKDIRYNHIENRAQNTFFHHLYEYRNFYELLTLTDTLPNLNVRFLDQLKYIFANIYYIDASGNVITINHYNTYKMYGSYGVLIEWIESGCKESPDEISAALLSTFQTHASSFRFIEKE